MNLPLAEPVNGVIFLLLILVIAAIIVIAQKKVWPLAIAVIACGIAWFFLRHWEVPWHIYLASVVPLAALLRKPKVVTVVAGFFSILATVGLVNME